MREDGEARTTNDVMGQAAAAPHAAALASSHAAKLLLSVVAAWPVCGSGRPFANKCVVRGFLEVLSFLSPFSPRERENFFCCGGGVRDFFSLA